MRLSPRSWVQTGRVKPEKSSPILLNKEMREPKREKTIF